jgi:hypothetical protein
MSGDGYPLIRSWIAGNVSGLTHTAASILKEAVDYASNSPPCGLGIYFLIDQNELAYIGKSTSVRSRLLQHVVNGKRFDRYWCFGGFPPNLTSHLEGFYIAKTRPQGNGKAVTFHAALVPYLDEQNPQINKL